MRKGLLAATGGTFGLLAFTGTAHAALSTEIATGLTTIQTDALAAVDLVWPVLMILVAAFVVIKVVKRAANKIG